MSDLTNMLNFYRCETDTQRRNSNTVRQVQAYLEDLVGVTSAVVSREGEPNHTFAPSNGAEREDINVRGICCFNGVVSLQLSDHLRGQVRIYSKMVNTTLFISNTF